jgi:hypothetical protein
MVLQKNVVQVIFAKVKPPIKPLARPDPTPPTKDPLHALNAHPERMPILLVPYLAKNVTLSPTNSNPMLRNAFQCRKDSTKQAQQLKSNVRPVHLALGVKIVHWVMRETETIMMRQNVNNVNQVKRQSL